MTIQSLVVGATEIHNKMPDNSHATYHRAVMADPTFSKPFKIGLRKNAWLRADIEAWLNVRAGVVA